MARKNKKIRIGFWFDAPYDYTGGINYFENLLLSLKLAECQDLSPVIFFGRDLPSQTKERFAGIAEVKLTKVLTKRTAAWLLNKILTRIFRSNLLLVLLCRRHSIDLVSHAWNPIASTGLPPIISWIPDLQYKHLPHLFPHLRSSQEDKRLRKMTQASSAVIVSSHAAEYDLQQICAAELHSKINVFRFVSWSSILVDTPARQLEIREKYQVPAKYFMVPNQFWEHKNHQVVIDALHDAGKSGFEMVVVMTGNPIDYRTGRQRYYNSIVDLIEKYDLTKNVRLLGLIPYAHAVSLMAGSVAIINPSKFEGWSTSVEEARSLGKVTILSDIKVHREQSPVNATFFSCQDSHGLRRKMIEIWKTYDYDTDQARFRAAKEEFNSLSCAYGNQYADLVRKVVVQST